MNIYYRNTWAYTEACPPFFSRFLRNQEQKMKLRLLAALSMASAAHPALAQDTSPVRSTVCIQPCNIGLANDQVGGASFRRQVLNRPIEVLTQSRKTKADSLCLKAGNGWTRDGCRC
jgi:hypothetical protein